MQRLVKLMRRLAYPTVALLLLWAGYQIIASPYISQKSGKILAVYDGDSDVQNCDEDINPDNENHSEEALAGFCRAVRAASKDSSKVELLNVHTGTNGQTDPRSSRIYQQLASKAARGSLLGIISFLTSPDSPPVVRFCRTMQVPLLLVVAANDDLMAPAEDTRGIVFRMMPTNGRQAIDMADWLRKQLHPHQVFRVVLFHEPNSFGEFLQRRLTQELQQQVRHKDLIIYNLEVTEQLEFADLMPQLWCREIDQIVYLGFPGRALDLLNTLTSYKADRNQIPCDAHNRSRTFDTLQVLLSSGAYQDELNDSAKYAFRFNVFAMLPTRLNRNPDTNLTAPTSGQDDEESQDSEYGYDSYTLLERLANERFKNPSQPIEPPKTAHEFRFDENGELIPANKNKYQAYWLASSPAARQP
jgi:hypothetical protein